MFDGDVNVRRVRSGAVGTIPRDLPSGTTRVPQIEKPDVGLVRQPNAPLPNSICSMRHVKLAWSAVFVPGLVFQAKTIEFWIQNTRIRSSILGHVIGYASQSRQGKYNTKCISLDKI